VEAFMGFYSGSEYHAYMLEDRWTGLYAPVYWMMFVFNSIVPLAFWWRSVRRNVAVLFVVSILVNVGMWSERFLIVVQSMHRDFMPSAWNDFYPTAWDWTHLLGSIAFFAFLFLLFVRLLPAISIAEMRELVRESAEAKEAG
jgi:molybdopterin-containing oxidoreductase family membrane subunit